MARPLRVEYPGALYHITSRGNAQQAIFVTEQDRYCFLGILAMTVAKYNWLCHAYCLMDNHYHLVVETPDPNLSLGMRHLNGVYTQAFNRAHQRVGHVFQGRYKAIVVEKNTHLLELCRYVVLNPVRARMVGSPSSWPWSSYQATAFGKAVPDFLTTDWVLAQFSTKRTRARRLYREFVLAGISGKEESPWKRLSGQIFLGSGEFVTQMRDLLGERQEIGEIPRSQRYPDRPELAQYFSDVGKGDKEVRNQRICDAHLKYGYTLKDIADVIGLHYTTISKIVCLKGKN
ncbi:MAG: addiction module toxin RelE [Desulfobulbaceae bacterium]|nr:MAG: addiction module toxin RelE [Desulfobulbaceae bacterium]